MSSTDIVKHDWESGGLVPPRRLGALLSTVRSEKGLTLEEIVERAGGAFSHATLASVERGTTYVTDEELAWLAGLYEVEASCLVPARSKLVIDLESGRIEVPDHRPSKVGRGADRDEVLSRYLAMVYSMRQIEPGTTVSLRIDDLDVLGRALEADPMGLAVDLESLMEDPTGVVARRVAMLHRRLLIPAAGVLVALVGSISLVMVQRAGAADKVTPKVSSSHSATTGDAGGPDTKTNTTVNESEVEIGTAVVQERDADGAPGAVEVRN